MTNFRICPQCAGAIAPDKKIPLSVCRCGWFDPKSQRVSARKLARQAAGLLVVSMVLVALSFHHVAVWGEHAGSIPLLRLRQVIGVLGPKGYGHLAQACISAGKFECAENAFVQKALKSKKPDGYLDLARLESRLGKFDKAESAFRSYMKAGGKDGKALLAYGRLLEFHHQDKFASKMYRLSLKQARAENNFGLGAQATSGLIGILVREKKFKNAYVQIQNFRGSDLRARGYLNAEFNQIRSVVYPLNRTRVAINSKSRATARSMAQAKIQKQNRRSLASVTR